MYGGLMGFLAVSALLNNATSSWNPTTEASTMTTTTHDAVLPIANQSDFKALVLDSNVPVLVDMWATWCGPCRAQLPIVEQIAAQAGDKARVVKVNVDDAAEVAADLNVTSIPTLILFQGGKEVRRFVGLQSASTLSGALGL
jgi:thioredoxin